MSSPAGVIAVTSLLVVPELEQPLALRERNNVLRRFPAGPWTLVERRP